MMSDRDHASMCHFSSRDDSSYRRLKARIENVMLMHVPEMAWKVYEGCIQSVTSETLKNEILLAHSVLESIMTMLPQVELDINKENTARSFCRGFNETLVELNILIKEEADARAVDDQLAGIKVNQMEKLRNHLTFQIQTLNLFYSSVVLR